MVCERHWEDHETVWERSIDRAVDGRPVGDAFIPFADLPDLQNAVFGRTTTVVAGGRALASPNSAKRAQAPPLVTLSRSSAGGSPEELVNAGKITVQEYMRLISADPQGSGSEPALIRSIAASIRVVVLPVPVEPNNKSGDPR